MDNIFGLSIGSSSKAATLLWSLNLHVVFPEHTVVTWLKQTFTEADKNGDGSLSISEVLQLLHKLNVNLPRQKVKQMFKVPKHHWEQVLKVAFCHYPLSLFGHPQTEKVSFYCLLADENLKSILQLCNLYTVHLMYLFNFFFFEK